MTLFVAEYPKGGELKELAVVPMGKPRMTQRDRWAKREVVVRYFAYCDELRKQFPYPIKEILCVDFFIPMPKSWSKKKRAEKLGKRHDQRPDIDNLCKAVMDALAKEDSHVAELHARKYWSDEPGIEIATY